MAPPLRPSRLRRVANLAFCLLLSGCTNKQEASLAWGSSRPEVPFVMFYRHPGNSRQPIAGPIVGVWADGRIVRVESEGTIGTSYLEGKLTEGQLEQLVRFVASNKGLRELEGGHTIPHCAYERLLIRLKDHRIIYFETVQTVRGWFRHNKDMANLRQYLMSIEIAEPRPSERPSPHDWYE